MLNLLHWKWQIKRRQHSRHLMSYRAPSKIQPVIILKSTRLFTRINLSSRLTIVALDLATPNKNAVTLYGGIFNGAVEASITTQQVTTIESNRSAVTFPSMGSQRPRFHIGFTEIWWSISVDKILSCRLFDSLTFRHKTVAIVTRNNFRSPIKSFLQIVAHFTKAGQSHPATFHRTRAGQSMTFTFQSHWFFDGLLNEKNWERKEGNFCELQWGD